MNIVVIFRHPEYHDLGNEYEPGMYRYSPEVTQPIGPMEGSLEDIALLICEVPDLEDISEIHILTERLESEEPIELEIPD